MLTKDCMDLLTCDEAIEILRCGYNTLYQLLKSGELHAFKVGKVWKIPTAGIYEYIKKKSQL